ncbi:hypothetical protein CKO42_09500 [Lamprobacter modestohalophilus]|uniref:Uncharacterized protein n=1 Tax=Lamprobacter modestohalophilus TaxID=1064514 RepID=A0A9X0W9B2_9GAMM|nr:hypothetical protein [Lamprobacter modestohalophilus]
MRSTPLCRRSTPRSTILGAREQLRLLSSGSTQCFVSKRDLDELLIPVLGQVWREDFEDRLIRAMQRRRDALVARAWLIETADNHVRQTMQSRKS